MGCDGGTIPKRDELVKTKKKKEEKDKNADLMAKWQHCSLSTNKLSPPIVMCELGRLYNKMSVLEYLLDKESAPNGEYGKHIRSLKDVVTLNLTEKSGYAEKQPDIGGEYVDNQDARFVCPVVGLDMNGKHKFVCIRTCGCVMSERAIKEVKSDNCHKCNKEFDMEDVIVINGSEDEVQELRLKMEERRAREKEEKKKNRKRKANVSEESETKSSSKKIETPVAHSSSSSTSTSTSSVLTGKATKEYSVAKDGSVSETYKSLFTTHESAKNRPKAHWVTFNPCYY